MIKICIIHKYTNFTIDGCKNKWGSILTTHTNSGYKLIMNLCAIELLKINNKNFYSLIVEVWMYTDIFSDTITRVISKNKR